MTSPDQTRWERLYGGTDTSVNLEDDADSDGDDPEVEALLQKFASESRQSAIEAGKKMRWSQVLDTCNGLGNSGNGRHAGKDGDAYMAAIHKRLQAHIPKHPEEDYILESIYGRGVSKSEKDNPLNKDIRKLVRQVKASRAKPAVSSRSKSTKPPRPSRREDARLIINQSDAVKKRSSSITLKPVRGKVRQQRNGTGAVRPRNGGSGMKDRVKKTQEKFQTAQRKRSGDRRQSDKNPAGKRESKRAWIEAENIAIQFRNLKVLKKQLVYMRRKTRKNQKRRNQAFRSIAKSRSCNSLKYTWRSWRLSLRKKREALLRRREEDERAAAEEARRKEQAKKIIENQRLFEKKRDAELTLRLQLFSKSRQAKAMRKHLKAWVLNYRIRREEKKQIATRQNRRAQLDALMDTLLSANQPMAGKEEGVFPGEGYKSGAITNTVRGNKHSSSDDKSKRTLENYSKEPILAKGRMSRLRGLPSTNASSCQSRAKTTAKKRSPERASKASAHSTPRQTRRMPKETPKPKCFPLKVQPSTQMKNQREDTSTETSSTSNLTGNSIVSDFIQMQQRADARRQRREELKLLYKRKMEDKKRQERQKEIDAEKEKIAKLKADKRKRLEKLNREKKRKEKATRLRKLAAQKWALAEMHYLRASVLFRGWLPWRCEVEKAQAKLDQASNFHHFCVSQQFFTRWKERHASSRAYKVHLAKIHFLRKRFQGLRKWSLEQKSARTLAWGHYCKTLSSSTFSAWRKVYGQLREVKLAKLGRIEQLVLKLRNVSLLRDVMRRWKRAHEHKVREKEEQDRYRRLKSRVKDWLSEIKVDPDSSQRNTSSWISSPAMDDHSLDFSLCDDDSIMDDIVLDSVDGLGRMSHGVHGYDNDNDEHEDDACEK